MSYDFQFKPGDRVVKTGGYPFPGVVEVAFRVTNSEADRYVVNYVDRDGEPTGLLHIFAPAQLRFAEGFDGGRKSHEG